MPEPQTGGTKGLHTVTILSLIIALAGVTIPPLMQVWSTHQGRVIKEYEVSFLEKRKAYAHLMTLLVQIARIADAADSPDERGQRIPQHYYQTAAARLDDKFEEVTQAEYELHPFLSAEARKWLSHATGSFSELTKDPFIMSVSDFRAKLWSAVSECEETLYSKLFEASSTPSVARAPRK